MKSFWWSPVPPTPGLFCGPVIRRMVPAPPQTPSSHVLRRPAVLCSPLIGLEHARACAQGPGAALHVRRAAVFTRRAAPFSTTMLMLPSLAHLTKLSTSSELATAALDAQHERQKRPCAAARSRVFAAQRSSLRSSSFYHRRQDRMLFSPNLTEEQAARGPQTLEVVPGIPQNAPETARCSWTRSLAALSRFSWKLRVSLRVSSGRACAGSRVVAA